MSYLAYSRAASYMHWIVAFPLIGSVASVLQAQSAPKEQKGDLMRRHKSLGLLTGMLVAPRVAYRMLSRDSYHLVPLVGNTPTENVLANITHKLLYGFMIIMPASGIVAIHIIIFMTRRMATSHAFFFAYSRYCDGLLRRQGLCSLGSLLAFWCQV